MKLDYLKFFCVGICIGFTIMSIIDGTMINFILGK